MPHTHKESIGQATIWLTCFWKRWEAACKPLPSIRCRVLLPIPPFRLYNYILPFDEVNSKISFLALGGGVPIHCGI